MATLDEVYTAVAELRGDVHVLTSHVIGNGAPGLIRRVADHIAEDDKKLEGISKTLTEFQALVEMAKWGIPVLVAIGPVIGFIAIKLGGT